MNHTAADHRPFLVSLVLLAVFLGGCGESRKAEADNPANAPQAAVVKVERRNLADTLEIASEFLPYQEMDVYAKVSGYIQKLYVDWGDARESKASSSPCWKFPSCSSNSQQDEATVRRSDQDVARAHEEQSRAESAYNVAHITYTRLADVQKSRPELVAQQEIDVAQGKDLEASAGVSSAKDALAAAEQALLSSKAALDKDKALVCVRAHDRAFRRRGDANLRLHRRAASGGNFVEQRRLRALPPLAE